MRLGSPPNATQHVATQRGAAQGQSFSAGGQRLPRVKNVVVVMTDSLRPDYVGGYRRASDVAGMPGQLQSPLGVGAHTPVLDNFASRRRCSSGRTPRLSPRSRTATICTPVATPFRTAAGRRCHSTFHASQLNSPKPVSPPNCSATRPTRCPITCTVGLPAGSGSAGRRAIAL